RQIGSLESDRLFHERTLPSGDSVAVFQLSLPTRRTALAVLALVIPATCPSPLTLDPDILDSLVKRLTLAIENATLYRALARRSGDLQRAYADLAVAHQELVRVDEMKTNFLANVSHEFRTPLTSIRSFSELLLSYEDDPTLQREFLEIINTESERLTRMVNDVLDITQIESGHLDWHMTTMDVASLIHESGRTYARVIEQQNLTFQEEVSANLPAIHGDHDRLQQVIGNLLNNALKFTRAGTIKLGAWSQGDEILISVADTGVGISPKDHERIFEKFQQVGAMLTDKPRGAGLGLSICREIVEHHQGRIWVDSKPGGGSTFTFSLKAVADSGPSPDRSSSPVQTGGVVEAREEGRTPVIVR
ncbi:MAG: sensor histidine kinase, partial [Chloroflexota bacterium]